MNFVTHQNGSSWADVIDRKWWVNQREALRVVDHYLNQDTSRQAMVRMPTGTGKTVVIATLAQLVVDHPRCVIVAPWENLVQQIQREVATRVWEKVEEQDAITAKPTAIFTPSTFKQMLGTVEKSGTLLCTYQTLQALQKHRTAFRALKQWATLALIDEGHREPAPRWAEAVRGLECPTVLFTATPYRNDLKLFDVARDAFYSFTFGEALSNHLVREVQFVEGTWSLGGSNAVGEFVDQLLATCASAEGEFGIASGELRAIVRCETATEIRAITAAIQARGESVVGIHERFHASDGTSFRNEVPDPQTESAKYWVHQYKLLEGLDDPRFRLVAVHGAFKNARNLVQQVGRVIRNPTRQANQKAIVLTHRDQRQRRLWERFIEYEGEVFDRKGRGQTELAAFEDFLASRARAPKFYFLGDFRRHLQPEDVTDPRDVIRIRKSVLVLFPGDKFAWRTLVSSLKQELLVNDAIPYGAPYEEPGSFLQLFQISEQSPLVSEAFLDVRLGYVFVRRIRDLLFYYDSEGRASEYLRKNAVPVEPGVLQRLLPDSDTTIREVSLLNGDFGNHAFRRRVLSTDSLDSVPPSLSDYIQICSTAIGSVAENNNGQIDSRRRYLSFTKGRLAERTTPLLSFSEFEQWLDSINAKLTSNSIIPVDTLARFARPHSYDGSARPAHVLFDVLAERIDISAMEDVVVTAGQNYWTVVNGKFSGDIDNKHFDATITFNAENKRFEIESPQLDRARIAVRGGQSASLVAYLNETQNFRVLLNSGVFCAQGRFFTPNLKPWRGGGSRLNVGNIVTECASLGDSTSEKGNASDDWTNGWPSTSVFGSIANPASVFAAVGWQPEILVCNDVAHPEIADFFALDETSKVVAMLHAKFDSKKQVLSASAFHEVCSQAIRYLGFLNPSDTATKLSADAVGGTWCPDSDVYPRLNRLVWPQTNATGAAIARKFAAAVADPSYRREVWLVMGHGLSKSEFDAALAKRDPRPNEKEISYLFQSTWCAVASVGATLRVICKP